MEIFFHCSYKHNLSVKRIYLYITGKMSINKVPNRLRESFACFFLNSNGVSNSLDIKCILAGILDKGPRTNALIAAVCQFMHELMIKKTYFLSLSSHSFHSQLFGEQIAKPRNEALPFFHELVEWFLQQKRSSDIDSIIEQLIEIAVYVILFNKVSCKRIETTFNMFLDCFDFVIHYQTNEHESRFNSKICSCETYKRSGDCNCENVDLDYGKHDDFSMS